MPAHLKFPLRHKQSAQESEIFRHLRNNSNYLAPGGFIEKLRIPALLVRGIIINVLIILPYILAAAILTPAAMQIASETGSVQTLGFPGNSFNIIKLLASSLLVLFAAYPLIHMFGQKIGQNSGSNWRNRNLAGKFLGLFVIAIGVMAFIEFQPHALNWVRELTYNWNTGQYGIAAIVGTTVAAAAALDNISDKLRAKIYGIARRYAFYAIGLLGTAAIWFFYLLLCIHIQDNPAIRWSYGGIAVSILVYTLLTVDVNFTGIHKFYRDRLSRADRAMYLQKRSRATVVKLFSNTR